MLSLRLPKMSLHGRGSGMCMRAVPVSYTHLLAPYKGFVDPKYEAVTDADGTITDVTVTYDEGLSLIHISCPHCEMQ